MKTPMLHLATVGAPFGVRGAFRLKTLTEDPLDALSYGDLQDAHGTHHAFHVVRVENAHTLIVTSPSIKDRTMAEEWRGTKFYIEKDKLPSLGNPEDDDTFYIQDLEGMRVISAHDGTELGYVLHVINHGASDILIVKTQSGEAQIAFIQDAIHTVDADKGMIIVEPDHLI